MKPKTGFAYFLMLVSSIALVISLFLPFVQINGRSYTYIGLVKDLTILLPNYSGLFIIIFVLLCLFLFMILLFTFICKPIPLIVFNVLYFIANMFLPGRIFGLFAEGAYGTVIFYIASILLLLGSIIMAVQKKRQKTLYNDMHKVIDTLHSDDKEEESKTE